MVIKENGVEYRTYPDGDFGTLVLIMVVTSAMMPLVIALCLWLTWSVS